MPYSRFQSTIVALSIYFQCVSVCPRIQGSSVSSGCIDSSQWQHQINRCLSGVTHAYMMQTVNNYDRDVFNGDPGFVVDADPAKRQITVEFAAPGGEALNGAQCLPS